MSHDPLPSRPPNAAWIKERGEALVGEKFVYTGEVGHPSRREPPRSGLPHANGISELSYRHDAIVDWMIANPDRPLKACAQELGYSQNWLSCVVHSDAFQAEYEERRKEIMHPSMQSLANKLTALAHETLDRQMEMVAGGKVEDPRVLSDMSEKTLSRLGYGTQKGGPGGGAQTAYVQNNYYTQPVDRESLERARARMHQGHNAALEEKKLIEGGGG